MAEKILETLQSIGFTEGEAKCYSALISLGSSTVGPIIDKSGISASKAYVILERLINKGLVSAVVEEKTKRFSATNPELLLNYLDEEQQKIEKNKAAVQKILPSLHASRNSATSQPLVEISRGSKGFEAAFEEFLAKAPPESNYLGVAGHRISFALQHYWYKQSERMAAKKIKQMLTYEHSVWYKKDPVIHQRHRRKLYYPKVLPEKYVDLPNLLTLGDYALITDIQDEEVFTLLIRNKNLTSALKKLMLIIRDAGYTPEGYPKQP